MPKKKKKRNTKKKSKKKSIKKRRTRSISKKKLKNKKKIRRQKSIKKTKDKIEKIYKTKSEWVKNGLVNNLTSTTGVYDTPLIYIIGLYSRNGTFFEPYIPYVPEINFYDFIRNIHKIGIASEK